MKIPVLGMDPSLRNWGLASAELDLETGELSTPHLSLVETKDLEGKQVRQNSSDLHLAEQLASAIMPLAHNAKVIFVECPTGSQSARAMASYGICVGVLGALRAISVPLVEVTALESKLVMTGLRTATKQQMIQAAFDRYPNSNWPKTRNGLALKAEHMADAIAAIHAGVRTPTFQNLMRLFKATKGPIAP
jgi:Holliday junction resolvasome RuvABC endonuclease subunit